MKRLKFIKLPSITFLDTWKNKIKERTAADRKKADIKMQSDEMLSLTEKLKLHRIREHIKVILIVTAVLITVTALVVYNRIHVRNGYQVISSVERTDDAATSYVRLKNCILKCNPNGVTCVNGSNEVQWNVTFTMQSPIVDVCGSTVVVGDQRGNTVYVFDKNGEIGHFEVEHTLTKVRVSNQGVVAAVLEDGEVTWVNVYDSQGTLLVKNKTSMNITGYPVDIDLSSDGRKLMVSYLGMDNNDVVSKVAFYNFSTIGQSETDYLVNQAEYSGMVVPEVCFLDRNYAVAFRDNGMIFFSGRQVPEEGEEVLVEQEIISAFHNEKYVGIVTPSDEKEQKHKYKLQIFRCDGSRCGVKYFDMEYTDISVLGEEILMHNTTEIEVYGISGRKKASIEYEKPIIDIMRVGGQRKYDVFTTESTDRIKIK
ncbi:MAG: DUF5711 family protein [Marvinbryantia sp.]|jgi:hypothetical protein